MTSSRHHENLPSSLGHRCNHKYNSLHARNKFLRSSNNVLDVVVFKVVRDTLEKLPEDNLFNFPSEGNELTMTVYR